MPNNTNTPYSNLDPSLILNAIDSVGYRCSGSLTALNSYENRVYQVGIEDEEPLIAKFYRPNRWTNLAILEEHQFSAELLTHEIPVIAPLITAHGSSLHEFNNFRFALFPRKGGHALELESLDQLEWMGRFIGRLHAVSATRHFEHRMRLDINTYGYAPYQILLASNFIPLEVESEFKAVVEAVLKKSDAICQQIGQINYIRLHGDCHAGNVLWNNSGPQIVDLDDCLMGPAVQDIWMLLSGDAEEEIEVRLNRILRGYRTFHDFDIREVQLIEVLRTLRMIHYSAWLTKRWDDPTFPINFPWFNTHQYWLEQVRNLKIQQHQLEKIFSN